MDKALVIEKLNRILELELAGVVRYTHYLKPITDMQALAHGGLPALAPPFFMD